MASRKNKLSKEQIKQLAANRNVRLVTETTVSFTEEFEKIFYYEHMDGKRPADIFLENGIDPKVLGSSRIRSFAVHNRQKGEREEGFKDERSLNERKPPKEPKSNADRITQLEHELAYTKHEVEFLKKIATANMEARIAWESKHQQK